MAGKNRSHVIGSGHTRGSVPYMPCNGKKSKPWIKFEDSPVLALSLSPTVNATLALQLQGQN